MRRTTSGASPKEKPGDRLAILAGTGQNLAGLVIYVVATFGTNILISRVLGAPALGIVTLATQFAFVAGAATRFGMDMAAVRWVAIDVGKGRPGRARAIVAKAAAIAAAVSCAGGLAVVLAPDALARAFGVAESERDVFVAAAIALPFVALSQVYLGGTRGLKIMRHTLLIYWAGQPAAWVAFMLAAWALSMSVGSTVLAYAASWAATSLAAWLVWRRESRDFGLDQPTAGETARLIRYGAPRAPAALFAQLLFWTDYFVLSRYVPAGTLGVYAAAVRVAQALMLFLVALNYMFSPFVADLHARGERERLDELYKALTRWTLAGTMPLLLLLLIVPAQVLLIFGGGFEPGTTALRILLIGQIVNVGVGSVGFILIMVGRTGWDLSVIAASFLLDLVLSFLLAPALGPQGAATAQAVTLITSNTLRLYLVWRFLGIQPFDRHYVRLAVPAAVAALAMIAAHALLGGAAWVVDLAGTAAAGMAVYAAALLLFGLTPSEREAVRRILRLA